MGQGYVAVWPSFERCGRDAEFLKAPCLFGSDAIDSGPFAFSAERFANNSASDMRGRPVIRTSYHWSACGNRLPVLVRSLL
jgi:hypothetical protein